MWFRSNAVNILKYLPEFLQSDLNFKSVADVCSVEHEKIRLELQDIFNQFFIETATWGLSSYERILNITPKSTDNYTARRNRILARYQTNQTSTVAFLTTLAQKYISTAATVTVVEDNENYSFSIVTDGGSVLYLSDLIEAINLYKPAHLGWLLHYDRPVNMEYSIGYYIRISKTRTIKPVADFSLNTINGTAVYGCYIKLAKIISVKVAN